MLKIIAKLFVKFGKWRVEELPDVKKAIITVAPHTSTWDFIYGRLYFALKNKKPHILIKKEFFKWPLGFFLKKLGGVPIDRKSSVGATKQAIGLFDKYEEFYLIITPEATRKKTKNWKKGFIRIAKAANVPVIVGFFDCENKIWGVKGLLDLTGTDEEVMNRLKEHYKGLKGVNPEKFETGLE